LINNARSQSRYAVACGDEQGEPLREPNALRGNMKMPDSKDSSMNWYREAIRHNDNRDLAQGLVCIEHHLRLRPDHIRGRILYAEMLTNIRRFTDAEAVLHEVALEVALPEVNEGHWMICAAWMRHFRTKGDIENAVVWARRLIQLRPDWTVGYIFLGSSLARLGRFDDAVAAYEPATKLPANAENSPDEAYLNIALIRRAQHRFDEALVLLNRAIEIDPDYEPYKTVRDDILAAVQLENEIKESTTESGRST
jgi:tetratricopeptide (TPR) repeat protein